MSHVIVTPGEPNKIEVEARPPSLPLSHSDLLDLDRDDHPRYAKVENGVLTLNADDPLPEGYTGLYVRLPA